MKIRNRRKDIITNKASTRMDGIKGLWQKIKEFSSEKIKGFLQKRKKFFAELVSCINVNRRKFIKSGVLLLIALLLILAVSLISSSIARNVPDQNSYLSWGGKNYAQISCYTSRADGFSTDEIMRFEYEMNQALKTSSSKESETLKWTDAYSGIGKLTIMNGNTSVEGTAYGVGNSFFAFHPLQLLYGGYIDTKNIMKDYILLDEEAAWRLFGSSDVAGMYAYINGEPHVVAGVYKRPQGRLHTASGNGEITCYVSYEVLMKYNKEAAITCYEVIMENSVKQYAYDYVKNYFQPESGNENGNIDDGSGGDKSGSRASASGLTGENSDRDITIIENSDRYSMKKKWECLKNFGINSMKLDEIVYPFWENIAKAYESILALLFFFQIIGWAVVVLCIVEMIVRIHRFRKRLKTE